MTGKRRVRALTLLVRMLLALALLAGAAAAALHWASRSDAVLRWAVAQIAQRLPGQLVVSGMRGALARPVHIDAIEYVQDDLTVKARDLDLEWSPSLLALDRRLWIHSLRIGSMEIITRPTGKSGGMPDSLEPPLPVSVDRLQLATLRIAAGATPLELSNIDLRYAGDARFHTLDVARLDLPWGSVAGKAQLLTQPPFTLSGKATLRSSAAPDWPVSVQANLAGSLGEILAQGEAQVRDLPPIGASAVVKPFDAVMLDAVEARIAGLDIAQLAPGAPHTALDAQVKGRGTPSGSLTGQIEVINRASGAIDRERLPVTRLLAGFEAEAEQIALRQATVELGGRGRASGEATLARAAIGAQLAVSGLDLALLHSALRSTALDGTLQITRTDAGEQIALDLGQGQIRVKGNATRAGDRLDVHQITARIADGSVAASGQLALSGTRAFNAAARFSALDPARLGDLPPARLTGRADARGQLVPTWKAQIAYQLERSQWRKQALSGAGRMTLSPMRMRDVDAHLALAANRLALRGAFGQPEDRMQFKLQAPALAALDARIGGSLDAEGTLGGTLQRLDLDAALDARDLVLPAGYRVQKLSAKGRLVPGDDPRISATARADGISAGKLTLAAAQLDAEGTRGAHRVSAQARRGELEVLAVLEGGLTPALDAWRGSVRSLEAKGVEPLRLVSPAALAVSRERLAFGPAEVAGKHGRLHIAESVVSAQRVTSSGSLEGLRLARVLSLLELKSPVETDLVLGARWTLAADRQMNGRIEVFRESGDVRALIDDQPLALGLERLAADLRIEANRVSATASAAGAHVRMTGQLDTRIEQRDGRWGFPGTAPLVLQAEARLDSIKPVAALFTRSVELDGTVSGKLTANGSVARPKLAGTIEGGGLSVEQVGSGLYLTDGQLTARFEERRLRLERLTMQGGEGRLVASGEYDLQRAAMTLDWSAERLTAVQRPDLLLVASGSGAVAASEQRTRFAGKLRMDKGRVELREAGTRSLGDDVVVAGRKPPAALPERVLKSEVDFSLGLGDDFRVSGRGLDARMAGQLHLTSPGNAPLRAQGEIKVAKGTFEIYGKKLDIDPGALYFAGPLDNPALDIRAMRKNQAVEAGVEITGTARNMEIRLVSVPDVPDMEKLSWLTLGRKLDTSSQSETEAMQRYGAALATTIGTGSFQSKVAHAVGLDEITVLPGTGGSSEGGVVQLGKSVGNRIYLILEQRMSTAENIFKVNYRLSRDWSLRLESGDTDALDLFYTITFD
jgi:translocation and assembly module TamB